MSTIFTETKPLARVNLIPVDQRKTRTATLPCLVLCNSAERSRMFLEAAAESGWTPVVCREASQASAQTARFRFPLVIVDIEGDGGGTADDFQRLAEQLSREHGRLLMICGDEENPLQEIWARQLGAWLYLPGVDETSDMTLLCGEARTAADKLELCITYTEK